MKANVGTCAAFALSLCTSSCEHNNLQHSELSGLSYFVPVFGLEKSDKRYLPPL
jgi:hypothetical protein